MTNKAQIALGAGYRVPPVVLIKARGDVDFLKEPGAKELAARIEKVWHKSGHTTVRAWAERDRQREIWVVKTNLIRGRPPLVAAPACRLCGRPTQLAA